MATSPRSRWLMAAAGASSIALALTGCSSSSETATDAGSASAGGADACAAYTQYGDLSGKEVNIYASILSPELEMYEAAFVPFEECTGANRSFEGSHEFEAQLPVRVKAGNPPTSPTSRSRACWRTMVATGSVQDAVRDRGEERRRELDA